MKSYFKKKYFIFIMFLVIVTCVSFVYPIFQKQTDKEGESNPHEAQSHYRFVPTDGTLVTGTAATITSATARAAEGVNVGSWKGTLGDDSLHWVFTGTASGYDAQITLGASQLGGANKLIIQTEADMDATVPATVVQICDFVSSTGVNNAASGACTTGGWRTLNNNNNTMQNTSTTYFSWHIYDGYWSNGSNTPLSTPLTNFVNGSNGIVIRYYSTTNATTTANVAIDFLRVFALVHPLYTASSSTNLGVGVLSGEYTDTTVITNSTTNSQNADDNLYLAYPGTVSSIADFYSSFTNVKTYTGMNTIVYKAIQRCSTTGINVTPKIYNFNSSSWENLSAATACSATENTRYFALNNVTISNYISNGEVRVGWYGSGNSTVAIQIESQYIMLGTTNTSTSDCEITFGTLASGDCSNTRTLNTIGADSNWNILNEDESNSVGHDYFPGDNDGDVTVEEAASINMKFNMTRPNTGYVVGLFPYVRMQANTVTGSTRSIELRDYGNRTMNTTSLGSYRNGFVQATTITGTTMTALDTIFISGHNSLTCNDPGCFWSTASMLDTLNNQATLRIATSVSGATANNSEMRIDFAMMTMAWTEDSGSVTETYAFTPIADNFITGTHPTNTAATAATAEGVEAGGGWQALLADDAFHMGVVSTSGGYNAEVTIGRVQLNGANAILLNTEIDEDATVPQTLWQICDFVNTASVDHVASGGCTGGGWRTLNNRKVTIAPTTSTVYTTHIYNGYWSNGSNTSISTPMTNFVNGSNQILIRYYSTTSTLTTVNIDWLRAMAWKHPYYFPAGFTNLGVGTVTGDYMNTNAVTLGASDNTRLQVAGTAGSVSDFYLSFKNIETYTGMNTIALRAELANSACTTVVNIQPSIYNFNTSSWQNLTGAAIACTATDTIREVALNNVTISDYISNGEIRIRWTGSANSVATINVDTAYIFLGTTNTNSTSSDCFVSFGTTSTGSCVNTRTMDTTGANSSWTIATEDESATFGHDYYAFDVDNDVNVEEGSANQVKFAVTRPANSMPVSLFNSGRMSAGAGGTILMSGKDYSGANSGVSTLGSFANLASSWTTTVQYFDNITASSAVAAQGWAYNVEDMINTLSNEVMIRVRTSVDGTTATNATREIDFMMVGMAWIDTFPEYVVSGNIYQSGSESTLDTTAYTVALSVNNGTPITTTASGGSYTFAGKTFSAGDQIAVYIQGDANDANSISEVSAADQSVNLYVGRTAIYHTHTDATTNVEVCGQSTYPGSGDNLFTCSSDVPTYTSSGVLVIDEYSPGGDVITPALKVGLGGTYLGASETLTISGSGTGTSRPFIVDGTFTPTTNIVSFTGTSAVDVQATTYNDLYVYPASGTQTYTLGTATSQTITINDDFLVGNGGTVTVNHTTYDPVLVIKGDMTIHTSALWSASDSAAIQFSPAGTAVFTNNGSLDSLGDVSITGGTSTPQLTLASGMDARTLSVAASHIFNGGGTYTITIYGTTGTLITNGGTFTPSTSTVVINGDGSPTLTSGAVTFYNLTINPELTTTRTYTFGSGAITINNNFYITPTSTLVNNNIMSVVNGIGGISVSGQTRISPSSTAYGTLSLGDNPLTSNSILVDNSRGTLSASAAIITVTGTSGTPFQVTAGTFTEGSSLVTFTGNATLTLSSGITTFYNVEFSPTITANRVYTLSSSAVNARNITMNPTGSGGTFELQLDMANTITSSSTISITQNSSATSEWNTTGGNYALQAVKIEILSGGTLTANGSTITLTGSSVPFAQSGGTFTAGTSTVVFNANADVNPLTSGVITFNNVTISPTITLDHAYQFTAGSTITFTGDLSIVPSASGSPYELTFNTGGIFTGGVGSDIVVNPTGTATVVFTTNLSNYAVTMRSISIDASTTWESNASTVTLTGAVQFPFDDGGTHNSSSASYVYNGDYNGVEVDGDTYGSLTLSPEMLSTDIQYTFTGPIEVNNTFYVIPDAATPYQLTVLLNGDLTGSADTIIQPYNSAVAIFDTVTGSNYAVTTGDFSAYPQSFVYLNGSLVDINGNFELNTADFTASGSTMNISGNITNNNGIFNNSSGTVELDGTSQQTVSGPGNEFVTYPFYAFTVSNNSGTDPDLSPSVIFLNSIYFSREFTVATGDVKLRFNAESTYQINTINWDGQSPTTRLTLRSSISGIPWYLNAQNATSVLNVDAKDSDASGGFTIDATDSSNLDSTGNSNWTFTSFTPSLTFSLSDNSIGFGNLTSSGPRYATGDTLGTGSETVAHTFDVTTNAPSGYLVTVSGSTLVDGAKSIDVIGGTSAASSTGTEQFGLRISASGGSGVVSVPYNHASNYAYDGVSIPDEVASASTGDSVTTTYSVRYLGNISNVTEAGSYGSTLTYVVTGNF